jgi:hypothetical protein
MEAETVPKANALTAETPKVAREIIVSILMLLADLTYAF